MSTSLNLEVLVDKIQASCLKVASICMKGLREAEAGGHSRDTGQLNTSFSTDKALSKGQFPPAACLSPGLA